MLPAAGDDPRPRLLIVGCSTRAAAWSAMRAGFRPVCADQFGDLDLHAVAEVIPVTDYPGSLPQDLCEVQTDFWMYTGAMENYPAVLTQLESLPQLGELYGITATSLATLRDPWFLQEIAQDAGLPTVACRDTPPDANDPSPWLLKPQKSGGGIGVRRAEERQTPTDVRAYYWQRFITGPVGSAVFRIQGHQLELIGFTRLQCGLVDSGCTEPFSYGGNIGPWELRLRDELQLIAAAHRISQAVPVRGLFGIDFVWTNDGPCLLEVNPRYTASVELLESAWQFPALSHAPLTDYVRTRQTRSYGKRVLYARSQVMAPDLSRLIPRASIWSISFAADLPHSGHLLEPGQPVCTIFATGSTEREVERKLQRRIQRVFSWFKTV